MTTKNSPAARLGLLGPWRRAAALLQALVLLALPFLEVGGQSALRFDIPLLRLYLFGSSLWMEEFFLVLLAVLFLAFLFIALTMLFGRLWCGWSCPQTVLSDLTEFLQRPGSPLLRSAGSHLIVLGLSALVAADIIWYFIPPREFLAALRGGGLTAFFFLALTAILYADLAWLRRTFCAKICPYARMQGVMYDPRTMAVAYDTGLSGECMGCRACVTACPVGLDIRKGADYACIECARCRDACIRMRAKLGKGSLVRYFFGGGGAVESKGGLFTGPLRTGVFLAAAASLVMAGMLVYLLSTRPPFDFTLGRDINFAPRLSAEGAEVTNAYMLKARNLSARPLRLSARVQGGRVLPDSDMELAPGASVQLRIYITAEAGPGGRSLELILRDLDGGREVVRSVGLDPPGAEQR